MVFLVSMERKKTLNIPAEGFEFIISTFSGLILKLKSTSGTSFGLYSTLHMRSTVPMTQTV